ncbi:beta strand repeat-containing protein, partial [Dickeya undicola]|uniref:beta strand repeat-containing protein n=1 Tax=Dickeya undicola TaxID=1577887 RepID=UPI000532CF44
GGTVGLTTPVLDNRGTVSGRQVRLQAGQLSNRGTLSADAGLAVQATRVDNGGSLLSGGGLTLAAGQTVNGGVLSGGAVTLSGDLLWNGGVLQGRQSVGVNVLTGFSQTADGALTSGGTVTLSSGALETAGALSAQGLHLQAGQWRNTGTVSLGGDGQLTLDALDNRGILLSSGTWDITGGRLGNSGTLQGSGLALRGDTLDNSGTLLGVDALTLTLTADGALTNGGTGRLLTQGAAVLRAATVTNDGEWQAGSLQLTGDSLRNGGRIQSDGDLVVTLADRDPPGTALRAVQPLVPDEQAARSGRLSNTGTLVSGGDSRITGRQLENQGTLAADGTLWLTADDTTNGGRLESRTLQLVGNQLSNGGTLLAEQGGVLSLTGALTVEQPGRLLSNGDWRVQAGAVNSQGSWQGNNLWLTADGLTLGGTLLAANDVTLTLTQGYDGGAGSRVVGNGGVTVTADTLTQQGELGGERLHLTTGTLTNGGRLVGLSHLDVTSRGALTNTADGALLGNGVTGITAAALDNAGVLQGDALTLQAGTVDNRGRIQGTAALTLDGVSRYTGTDGSQLLSGGTATLGIDNADNAGLWQAGALRFTGTTLTNSGTLYGRGGLTLDAARLTNRGQMGTQGEATLRGRQFDNGGTLTALGGFTAQYGDSVTNQRDGQLLSGGTGYLTTGTLDNQGLWQSDRLDLTADTLHNAGTLLGVTDSAVQLSGDYRGEVGSRLLGDGGVSLRAAAVSNGGQIQGRNGLTVQGGSLLSNLSGGQLLSGGALTLNAAHLTNAGWVQGTDLTLGTAQLDNTGTLQTPNGLTLHLPQWSNSGTVQAGQLDITTDGQLDNRGTLLGLTRLALQAAGITNGAGARLYSAGDLQLRTGTLAQHGQLAALGNLRADIGNPFTLTQTLAAGGQLTLNVTGDLVQAGTLQGNGVTVSSTGTLTQQGRIVAGTGTSTLSAAAINQTASGSVQGGGPLSLLATGGITNRGFVGTAGDLLVQAGGLIDNSSLLYGGGNLWLLSDALINRFGNILAGNSLWIQRDAAGNASSSVLNSSGTIETQRGDITVRTGTLTNQREGLTVTEGESKTEAVPDWVGGERVEVPLTWFKEGELGIAEFYTGCLRGGKASGANCEYSAGYLLAPFSSAAIQKVPLESKSISVSAQGGEARINSANDALITSSVLTNEASAIYARNNIVLSGNSLNNTTYQAGDLKRYLTYRYDSVEFVYGTWSWINDFANDDQSAYVWGGSSPITKQLDLADKFEIQNKHYSINYKPVGEPTSELINGQTYAATIQAGGAITANFTQNISNTSLQPGSGGFIPAIATPTLQGVSAPGAVSAQAERGLTGGTAVSGSALPGSGNDVALAGQAGGLTADYRAVTRDNAAASGGTAGQARDDLQAALAALGSPSLSDYPLPTGQNGLFVADTSSDSRYLIRSNPTLSQ